MLLIDHLVEEDDALPEIIARFRDPAGLVDSFRVLYPQGAKDVTAGGSTIVDPNGIEWRFRGISDVEGVTTGVVEPFHIVIGNIRINNEALPLLGVHVFPSHLVIDFQVGRQWNTRSAAAFISILTEFHQNGASISAPYWGVKSHQDFLKFARIEPGLK